MALIYGDMKYVPQAEINPYINNLVILLYIPYGFAPYRKTHVLQIRAVLQVNRSYGS